MQPGQALIDRQAGTEAHIGLVNPGCVCYSNALMQQLFRTTVFRAGILSARGASTDVSFPPSLPTLTCVRNCMYCRLTMEAC